MMTLPYDYPTNMTNLTDLFTYANDVSAGSGQFAVLGNGIGLAVFVIAFITMSDGGKESVNESITASSFIAAIISLLLSILNFASVFLFIIFVALFTGSFIMNYLRGEGQ